MKTLLPALAFALVAAFAAYLAHQVVGRKRQGGERGDYWTTVVCGMIVILSPLLLFSNGIETLWPAWYRSGRHLFLDRTGAFGWPLITCYLVALGLPLAVWLGVLGIGLLRLPTTPSLNGWLAGGAGFRSSRQWLLLCALPPLFVAALTLPLLGTGPGAHPAAAWASFVLLGIGLLGVYGGSGVAVVSEGRHPQPLRQDEPATPWSEALQREGINLRFLTSWPGRALAERPLSESARRLESRLRLMGARQVVPRLIEVLDDLLQARIGGEGALTRWVQAPDDCGQLEGVALVAHLLDRRYRAHTLVITLDRAEELARRLDRWLPTGGVAVIGRRSEIPPSQKVWVVEAEILSDRLLPQLQDPRLLERLGLVVWWDLHQYSGVLAAHLWAISRRLHRLLAAHGRAEVRTLALLRSSSTADAQAAAFVQRLLPLPLDHAAGVEITAHGPRSVDLHLIQGQRLDPGRNGPQPLALAAAGALASRGWTTHVDDTNDPRIHAALTNGGEALVAVLCSEATSAQVQIHQLCAAEVLALRDLFSQGGRATDCVGAHVALIAPAGNPYVLYLLEQLTTGKGAGEFGTSRRLLWARAGGELMRRHLLLALSEWPETRRGLLRHFLLDEELVRQTLADIAAEGNLTRREVRSLDRANRLVVDHRYQVRRLGDRSVRPLGTFGRELIEVRDPAAGGSVTLRLDRERLTLEAYPHRVFSTANGQRYRIDEWHSVEEVLARGWLACTREDEDRRTWRRRHATVFDIKALGPPVTVGASGRSFLRFAAELCYEEEVTGVVQVEPHPALTTWPRPESRLLEDPILASFTTRALVLGFRRPARRYEELAPLSLCEALRHVLPVHLGVEENTLELVPMWGEESSEDTYGLAIVDLHAGGIGLIEALQGDDAFLVELLRRTRDWLATCRCKGGRGCCLDTPSGRASAMDTLPDHAAALELLRQVP